MADSPQSPEIYLEINSRPGVQRDGTDYASEHYIDGQWLRFYGGIPKKMGGINLIDLGNLEVIRNMYPVVRDTGFVTVYLGRESTYSVTTYPGSIPITEYDLTPSSGFSPNVNNVWSSTVFQQITDSICPATGITGGTSYLVTLPTVTGDNIANTATGKVFYTPVGSTTRLAKLPAEGQMDCSDLFESTASGFVLAVGGYLFLGGNPNGGASGQIAWCAFGDMTNWVASTTNYAVVATTKLVAAYPVQPPAIATPATSIMVWALDSVWIGIKDTDPNAVDVFNFFLAGPGAANTTIISVNSIVPVNNRFYWIGNRTFYVFDGQSVKELDNVMNKDFFFNNLNWELQEKVWGYYNPTYDEVVWYYPTIGSTECNESILYSPSLSAQQQKEIWWDNTNARSAGIYVTGYAYPLLADANPITRTLGGITVSSYGIWQHETQPFNPDGSLIPPYVYSGVNQVSIYDNVNIAITSFYQTNYFASRKLNNQVDQLLLIDRFEPDFSPNVITQDTGTMTITVVATTYPQAPTYISQGYQFNSATQFVSMGELGRSVSFIIESNIFDGDYYAGRPAIVYRLADKTP